MCLARACLVRNAPLIMLAVRRRTQVECVLVHLFNIYLSKLYCLFYYTKYTSASLLFNSSCYIYLFVLQTFTIGVGEVIGGGAIALLGQLVPHYRRSYVIALVLVMHVASYIVYLVQIPFQAPLPVESIDNNDLALTPTQYELVQICKLALVVKQKT